MDPMDLLKKALDAWGLELVLAGPFETTYHIVKKDGGRKLRHVLNREALQDMQAIHGTDSARGAMQAILEGVFRELCAEPKPEPTPA